MRKIYFLFIFFIPFVSFSQNWTLINPDYHYHYRSIDSSYITNTIFVNSFQVSGTDTTFYLNKIGVGCDTCNLSYSEGGYFLLNQPQFLQRRVTKTDSCFIFSDTLNFQLFPKAHTGFSWLLDTIDSIQATILSGYSTTTFGVTDSVKIISLSNGDSIIISKNFGIIFFSVPYYSEKYELAGVETSTDTLGIHFPDFWDFYNFNIGDIFQYHYHSGDPGGSVDEIYKITILTKQISNDSLIYSVHKIGKTDTWDSYGSFNENTYDYNTTLIFVNNPNSFPNLYNGQLCYEADTHEGDTGFDNNYIVAETFLDTVDNLVTKHNYCNDCSTSNYSYPVNYPILFHSSWYYTSYDIYEFEYGDSYEYIFKEGLGNTKKHIHVFEQDQDLELIGYIKNGDTTGTVYSDSYLVKINDIRPLAQNIAVYPNPAKNKLTVVIKHSFSYLEKLTISNLMGQVVFEQDITNQGKIILDISPLQKGIYTIY